MPSWGQKEAAALCMEHLVDHEWHGYTQGNGRWGDSDGFCDVETPIGVCRVRQGDRDCSAGVVSAYEAAGISCGGATWTGDALDSMLSTGNFKAHHMNDGYLCDDGYIAREACADRQVVSDGVRDILESNNANSQRIIDKLCQLELDGVKGQLAQAERDNVALQNQLNMANLAASQIAQNGAIIDGIYNRLSQCPVDSTPVYGKTPIFTCNSGGCGCGN